LKFPLIYFASLKLSFRQSSAVKSAILDLCNTKVWQNTLLVNKPVVNYSLLNKRNILRLTMEEEAPTTSGFGFKKRNIREVPPCEEKRLTVVAATIQVRTELARIKLNSNSNIILQLKTAKMNKRRA